MKTDRYTNGMQEALARDVLHDIEETVGEVLIEGLERCDEGLFGVEAVVDDKHELGALGHAAEHLPVVCVYY